MGKYILIAKTLAGLEDILASEISNIGGTKIKTVKRAVIFEGDKLTLYKANYNLRTALRILRQINNFQFSSVDEFYNRCRLIRWDGIMNNHNTFAIYSTVHNSRQFRNSMFSSLKVKDAIVDYFRQKKGLRPNVDTRNPDIILNVHISNDQCTISLDSSGDSLHKRGYRTGQTEAPISEVLAAGMILISGWDGTSDFLDPMCGSGTLPIEAALIATNTPPGIFRKKFAFEKWADFDFREFNKMKNENKSKKFSGKIYASDISERNIEISESSAIKAGIDDSIEFMICDFKDLNIKLKDANIIINPPYGERLKSINTEKLYSMIGERLKHNYSNNKAFILSSSKENFNNIGLKHSKRLELLNGAIKCDFREYELFPGKRKI